MLNVDTICEDTLHVLRAYYRLQLEPFFSILADDCVWLGPGNLLASGAAAIRGLFAEGFVMPAYDLQEEDFRQIDTGCDSQCMVLGQYTLTPVADAEQISAARQRATFCYRLHNGRWELYHMHVSNEWNELVGEEVFPVHISTQTYRYVQKLLAESREQTAPPLIIKTDTARHVIDPKLLFYVQAMDKQCVCHMPGERRTLPVTFKELTQQLPPYFYRLHRSFCVNSHYVTKIERYAVRLTTGEELPIPKMRYAQVREELTALIEKQQGG